VNVGLYYLAPESQAELMAVSKARREDLAAKRAKQALEDHRVGERRSGTFDRRTGERRQFATMADKLAAEARRQDDRRFTGEALTDFGAW
jgi:hypothetical protein